MNLSVLLAVGALALAAPIGYLTYDHYEGGSATAAAASTEAEPAAGLLLIRFHHDGEPIAVTYGIARAEEEPFESAKPTLREGENVFEHSVDPAYEHWVSVESDAIDADPVGVFGARFGGMSAETFAGCDVVEVLIQTFARGGDGGITVFGGQCLPGPARHVAVESSGPTIALPWPTCPLDCGVQYGFGGSGGLEFEVPEGASRIDVVARWDPTSPMTETLDVWLTTPDAECGEGCWVAVATAEGAREVTFSYDAPAPGEYSVSTHFTMPAGASLRQDVWLEAVVHSS